MVITTFVFIYTLNSLSLLRRITYKIVSPFPFSNCRIWKDLQICRKLSLFAFPLSEIIKYYISIFNIFSCQCNHFTSVFCFVHIITIIFIKVRYIKQDIIICNILLLFLEYTEDGNEMMFQVSVNTMCLYTLLWCD